MLGLGKAGGGDGWARQGVGGGWAGQVRGWGWGWLRIYIEAVREDPVTVIW